MTPFIHNALILACIFVLVVVGPPLVVALPFEVKCVLAFFGLLYVVIRMAVLHAFKVKK